MPSERRDQAIDRLLRQTLESKGGAAATSACLDAETLAAWFDGTLPGAALEHAQAHAASCGRCRAIVSAMARADAGPLAGSEEPQRRSGLRWLAWAAPLTAAAAAVVLWVVVPTVRPPAPAPAVVRAPAPVEVQRQAQTDELKTESGTLQAANGGAAAPSAPPVAAAAPVTGALEAAPPPAAAARALAPQADLRRDRASALTAETVAGFAAAPIVVASPDASIRWRLAGSSVERSADGGATWNAALADAGQQLTAGSAPSSTICWVVGRAGTVLLSTDGRTFVRASFPEAVDLTAVEAADARIGIGDDGRRTRVRHERRRRDLGGQVRSAKPDTP